MPGLSVFRRKLNDRHNNAGDSKPNGRSHADKRYVDYSSSPNTADVNIGTWNVRAMKFGRAKDGKLENVKREMRRMKLDILGLCETRWQGNEDYFNEDIRIISAAGDG